MEQFVGGATADQLRPMTLEDEAVAVNPVGAEGTAPQLLVTAPSTSTPLNIG